MLAQTYKIESQSNIFVLVLFYKGIVNYLQ